MLPNIKVLDGVDADGEKSVQTLANNACFGRSHLTGDFLQAMILFRGDVNLFSNHPCHRGNYLYLRPALIHHNVHHSTGDVNHVNGRMG
ncbi:MAG: hypothetical protein ACHQKY_17560 [Terriglobia bacterium]